MSDVPLPPQISYGAFKPKGYYTQFKQWPITPLSSNQYWTPDEIIRFLVTIKSGVMDPYRSHIEILVTVPPQTYPVGGLQIDSSAQSFISQTVISSNNVEIERIAEYDTLACYLTDIGFSQYVCQSRDAQGLGYSNIQTHTPWSNSYTGGGQILINNGNGGDMKSLSIFQNNPTGLVNPCLAPAYSGKGISGIQNLMTPIASLGSTTITPSLTNILWQGPGSALPLSQVQRNLGRFNNVRSEYLSNVLQTNYPDSTTSLMQNCPIIRNQTYNVNQFLQNNATSGFNPQAPYKMDFNPEIQFMSYDLAKNNPIYGVIPNTCSLYGYQKAVCSQFCRGTNQAILSPTIPQCQMRNGQIIPLKVPVASQIFRIPLISAICGILIPPQQFLLIPIESMYNLLLQITLSRFAMFTTGYSDVHQFDKRGMETMQQRKWLISQISWNMHLYTFADNQVNLQIDASLIKGIPISTTSYVLASQYQLPNGQVVRNNWPIGSQAESVCQIILLFLSNQYQQYSFARKQFRLSNNISSFQVKFNTQFFPSQPIIGNAGNPQTLDTTGDCWPFYEQLLLSTNCLFNTNQPMPKINSKNFCINGRCYNVKNTETYYDDDMYKNPAYKFTAKSNNTDTAMGMPNFHQNRYLGKAAYVYTWQPYGHSKDYMNGLNTQGVQNFSVILNTTNLNPFPSDQTLLIFTRNNVITIYGKNGIKVIGV